MESGRHRGSRRRHRPERLAREFELRSSSIRGWIKVNSGPVMAVVTSAITTISEYSAVSSSSRGWVPCRRAATNAR